MRPISKFLWRKFSGDAGVWGTCRQFLVSTIGTYCSYCEVPLAVDLPIEHKAPKRDFYDYANRYGNFLLCCSACNSFKGAHPSRAEGQRFYRDHKKDLKGVDPDDAGAAYWLSLATMVWPDRLEGTFAWDVPRPPDALVTLVGYPDRTFGMFSYQWGTTTPAALAASGLLRFARGGGGAKSAWAKTPQTAVWVYPSLACTNVLLERVKNTIQTLNLNYANATRGTDRRVASRTEAWGLAEDVTQMLAKAVLAAGTTSYDPHTRTFAPAVREVVLLARQMVLGTGHWSAWAAVLDQVRAKKAPWNKVLKPVGQRALFRSLLVQFDPPENAVSLFEFQPKPPMVVPGTDPTRIP